MWLDDREQEEETDKLLHAARTYIHTATRTTLCYHRGSSVSWQKPPICLSAKTMIRHKDIGDLCLCVYMCVYMQEKEKHKKRHSFGLEEKTDATSYNHRF